MDLIGTDTTRRVCTDQIHLSVLCESFKIPHNHLRLLPESILHKYGNDLHQA